MGAIKLIRITFVRPTSLWRHFSCALTIFLEAVWCVDWHLDSAHSLNYTTSS